MNITFWVTDKCNLACKYCYVNKSENKMSEETARKACDFFEEYFEQALCTDERIHVSFHGGEPLLNFEIIYIIVEWFQKRYSDRVTFALTTNGTIYDERMFDFITKNIQISLSLDGDKVSNDTNRIFKNANKSVYDLAKKTFHYIDSNKSPCRIRMTVNHSNINHLYENYVHLYEMKPTVVSFALDASSSWTSDDMQVYYENYVQIINYLLENNREEAYYELYNFTQEHFRNRETCSGGIKGLHISSKGEIFPCELAIGDEEFKIGTVERGITKDSLLKFFMINKQEVAVCKECSFKNNCEGPVCKVINKYSTGDSLNPSVFICNENEVLYKVYKKYEYLLEEFNEKK